MPVNFEKIKQLREALNLTQTAAASAAGAFGAKSFAGAHGKMRWSDLESGRFPDPRISTLEAVAAVLRVPVQALLAPAAPRAKPPAAVRSPVQSRRRRPSGEAGSKG
jgi:transcriptional regulator with XRE-family HTH domain